MLYKCLQIFCLQQQTCDCSLVSVGEGDKLNKNKGNILTITGTDKDKHFGDEWQL